MGDVKAFNRVLNHTYGRSGKRKHHLLEVRLPPIYNELTVEPYYGFNPDTNKTIILPQDRSQPPKIPEPIWELMKRDPDVKHQFVMDNPPVYTKLSKKRETNQKWRHYMRQQQKLRAPLPLREVQHLQHLAQNATFNKKRTEYQLKWEKEAHEKRRATGKFQGFFHAMSSRFLRRRYQLMLNEYIPMITRDEEGKGWKIQQALNPVGDNYPPIPERHLQAFKMGVGVDRGRVDSNGAFVQPSATERSID